MADALVPQPEMKQEIAKEWRRAMLSQGLPPERADQFLRYNQAMLETVSADQLSEVAKQQGFQVEIEEILGLGGHHLLRTVVLRQERQVDS